MSFVLGEDGKVHKGESTLHMDGWACQIDCNVIPKRPIGKNENWWREFPDRQCEECKPCEE